MVAMFFQLVAILCQHETESCDYSDRCDIFLLSNWRLRFFWSLRYCVNIDHRITTIRFVATIFNTELVVVIFCSLRYHVNKELEVATIWIVAIIFQYRTGGCDFFCSLRYVRNSELRFKLLTWVQFHRYQDPNGKV